MKTQEYLVTIEMPDGDMIGPGWIKDIIQADCDVEDTGRKKVSVIEIADTDSNLEDKATNLRLRLSSTGLRIPSAMTAAAKISTTRTWNGEL